MDIDWIAYSRIDSNQHQSISSKHHFQFCRECGLGMGRLAHERAEPVGSLASAAGDLFQRAVDRWRTLSKPVALYTRGLERLAPAAS